MLTEAEVIERVKARHQFNTPAKGGPRPHKISTERYGEHASYVEDGRRFWGFEDKQGRNRFAADYENHTVAITDARARSRS